MKTRLMKLSIGALAVVAVPMYAATFTVQSCITTSTTCTGTGGTLAEPDQTLSYAGGSQTVSASGATTYTLGTLLSNLTVTGGPNNTFTLLLTGGSSPVSFAGTFTLAANPGGDTITFTGGGTETVGGTTFATVTDSSGTVFGVQSSPITVNPGKGTSIEGLIVPGTSAVPEPAEISLVALGIFGLSFVMRSKRSNG